jgi:hypothetical protein
MNKFRIDVDADLLQALRRCIDENRLPDHYLDEGQEKRLGELMDEVGVAWANNDLMETAGEPVFENGYFAAYEDPERGDEATLMVFSKVMGELFVNTPFHDCDDPQEIQDWLNGMIPQH